MQISKPSLLISERRINAASRSMAADRRPPTVPRQRTSARKDYDRPKLGRFTQSNSSWSAEEQALDELRRMKALPHAKFISQSAQVNRQRMGEKVRGIRQPVENIPAGQFRGTRKFHCC